MKQLIKIIIFFTALTILTIMVFGCKTCEPEIRTITKENNTITKVRYDSIIYFQDDSAMLEVMLKCDSARNVIIESMKSNNGKRTVIKYVFKDNKLILNAYTDSLALKNTIIKELREKLLETNKTSIVTVEKCSSFWHQLYKYLALIFAVIIILYLCWVMLLRSIKI